MTSRTTCLPVAVIAALSLAGVVVPAGAQTKTVGAIKDLCAGRAPCSVTNIHSAGKARDGRPLRVVELAVPVKRNYKTVAGSCPPTGRELWIVTGAGAKLAARRLMLLCNDGYGAAGLGEDSITVKPNRLIHVRNGGSAWRWDMTRRIQLSPPRVLTQNACSWHNIAPGFTVTRWSWTRFRGVSLMRPKACTDADAKKFQELGCAPQAATHRRLLVPHLSKAPALAGDDAPVLGSCALTMRETGKPGFVVYGKPAAKDGAVVRVLLVNKRDLLITVIDDTIQTRAKSWVRQDHIELWTGAYPHIDCERLGDPLAQWGIELGTGRVHRGFGKPKADPVVVGRRIVKRGGKTVVALRVRLPKSSYFGATVVYSKSRNGRQFRLTATSPIDRRDRKTIGSFFDVPPRAARCAMKGGALSLVETGRIDLLREE